MKLPTVRTHKPYVRNEGTPSITDICRTLDVSRGMLNREITPRLDRP